MLKVRAMPLIMSLSLLLSGCNNLKAWYATEFRQGEVTSGIARLSAQHLSMITSEVSKKFKEPNVTTKITPATDTMDVGKGTVEWTLENVELASPTEKNVFEDCLGTTATWRGKLVVVKATQTIYGRLTNNPQNPVIPDPGTVKFTIHVKPTASTIRFSDKEEYMDLDDGEITFDVYPRLAQAQEGQLKGLRVIPTSNTRYENVVMKNVTGTMHTSQVTLPFDISESKMLMQIGVGENGDENLLDGEIVAFGNRRKVPMEGHDLNPNYRAEDFQMGFSCKEGLKGVVEYKNVLFEEKIGPGVAGLTTLAMSKIASKLADDHVCGMASTAYLNGTKLSGTYLDMGESYGTLPGPCNVSFSKFRTEPDCFGIAHEITGEARVLSASKEMRGVWFLDQTDFNKSIKAYEKKLNAGDIAGALATKPEPILPKSRQPAVIEFTADLSDLVVTEVCLNQGSVTHEAHCMKRDDNDKLLTFSLHAGRVTAKLKPLMGKYIEVGHEREFMCAARSVPIAETEFRLEAVNATVSRSGNAFQLMADGVYRAINGKIDDRENELRGEMKIGRVTVPFKAPDKDYLPLKPDYDVRRFEDSFLSCSENKFIVPVHDSDCSLAELGF